MILFQVIILEDALFPSKYLNIHVASSTGFLKNKFINIWVCFLSSQEEKSNG